MSVSFSIAVIVSTVSTVRLVHNAHWATVVGRSCIWCFQGPNPAADIRLGRSAASESLMIFGKLYSRLNVLGAENRTSSYLKTLRVQCATFI